MQPMRYATNTKDSISGWFWVGIFHCIQMMMLRMDSSGYHGQEDMEYSSIEIMGDWIGKGVENENEHLY